MLSKPKISVIVPVYNGGAGLHLCLRAIKESSFSLLELLVVDNGSTDQSVDVAKQYADHVLHCPGPSGPGAARNLGVQHAVATILLFVDADVVVKSDAIARVVKDFEMSPDIAAVFGSYDDSPVAQNFLSQYKNLLHHFVHQRGNSDATTFWAGCGAVRKDVFQQVGGFDQEKYPKPSIEDIELGYRLKQHGFRILLNKDIQSTHLKEWRMGSLLRAEIFFRAIPWSELILERKGLINDLNLQVSQRISAGLAGLSCVLLLGGFIHYFLGLLSIVTLGIVLFINRSLFRFFLKKRGVLFSILAFCMHIVYYVYSSTVFIFSWSRYSLVGKRQVAGSASQE